MCGTIDIIKPLTKHYSEFGGRMLRNGVKLLVFLTIFLTLFLTLGCASRPRSCHVPETLIDKVSSVRELPLKTTVPCLQTNSEQELTSLLDETLRKRVSDQELAQEGEILKLIGAIPPDYKYREELLTLYASRLSAFYSPEYKRFVMAGFLGEDRDAVLAHELTHALQDQHYDLNALTRPEIFSDVVLARTAIFEGDANLTMKRATGRTWCDASTQLALERLEAVKNELSSVPKFLELQIFFPYLIGEQYICNKISESREKEGGGFGQALAEIYNNLPTSSAQLLGMKAVAEQIDGEQSPPPNALKIDSLGMFGIASLLSAEKPIREVLVLLNTFGTDRLGLFRGKDGNIILRWLIPIKNRVARRFVMKYLEKLYDSESQERYALTKLSERDGDIRLTRTTKIQPDWAKSLLVPTTVAGSEIQSEGNPSGVENDSK